MIDVFFDHRQRIALIGFSATLTAADLSAIGAAGRHLATHEAPAWRILDFSAVERVQVRTSLVASLGLLPPIEGERIYVVPNPELFGLARVYSSYQRHQGGNEPLLVASLDEACFAIGCIPVFEPYDAGQPVS